MCAEAFSGENYRKRAYIITCFPDFVCTRPARPGRRQLHFRLFGLSFVLYAAGDLAGPVDERGYGLIDEECYC